MSAIRHSPANLVAATAELCWRRIALSGNDANYSTGQIADQMRPVCVAFSLPAIDED
jgi:hypothetical protein